MRWGNYKKNNKLILSLIIIFLSLFIKKFAISAEDGWILTTHFNGSDMFNYQIDTWMNTTYGMPRINIDYSSNLSNTRTNLYSNQFGNRMNSAYGMPDIGLNQINNFSTMNINHFTLQSDNWMNRSRLMTGMASQISFDINRFGNFQSTWYNQFTMPLNSWANQSGFLSGFGWNQLSILNPTWVGVISSRPDEGCGCGG